MTGDTTFSTAVTRRPGRNFADGLTTASLGSPDFGRMKAQHRAYVLALKAVGLMVIELDALPDHPDAHFVEDTAVVAPELAVITRPGATARRGEEIAIEPELAKHKSIAHIHAPGTLDGGDVLRVGKRFFIGISDRTNEEGAAQLGGLLAKHGYSWTAVPLAEGLHLKSSVNRAGGNTLVVTESFADHAVFEPYDKIVVDPAEEYAANILAINERVLVPAGFERTRDQLAAAGFETIELEMSEAQKMDGGLTCMSLRF